MESDLPNTAKPNPFTTVTPLSKTLALILFISLPFIGFYLGIKYKQSTAVNTSIVSQVQNNTSANHVLVPSEKCKDYGLVPYSKYLTQYTVKEGDTILSIANIQLGSTSRVNELIALNKAQYPQLSMSNPFLEKGWIFYIPPKEYPTSGKNLALLNGQITSMGPTYFTVDAVSQQSSWPYGTYRTLINSASIKVGDCVSVLSDNINGLIYIKHQ